MMYALDALTVECAIQYEINEVTLMSSRELVIFRDWRGRKKGAGGESDNQLQS